MMIAILRHTKKKLEESYRESMKKYIRRKYYAPLSGKFNVIQIIKLRETRKWK